MQERIVSAVQPVELSLTEQASRLEGEIRLRQAHLDSVGPLAHRASKCYSWANSGVFDFTILSRELDALKNSLQRFEEPKKYRKICRFEGQVRRQSVGDNFYHIQVYHSLDYDGLRGLIDGLRPLQEYADSVGGKRIAVHEVLEKMCPGAAEKEYLTRLSNTIFGDSTRIIPPVESHDTTSCDSTRESCGIM
jgi:hypothetical protein